MQKKIAIIGAGISGLSAGCYAQMNGYAAQLFEAHTLPGGLCTSWKRKGYTIDGSCHWVTGSGPGDPYYAVWEELGAIQGRHYIDYEYFTRSAGTDGRVFSLYTDVDRLERHMKELSPADAEPTELFCGFIRSLGGFSMPVGKPGELMGIRDGIRMMRKFRPYMKLLKLLGEMTVNQLGAQFKDPLLRDVLEHAMYGASASVFPLVFTLATMNGKQAGYPLGGSLEFARAIEARLRDLGGTITYGAPVRKILERNGRTIGVQLADGREIEADYVVSACDMRSTLFELLDGSRIHPIHTELLDSGTLIPPMLQVSYGVDVDFSESSAGMSDSFKLPEPVTLGGKSVEWFNVKNYGFDPSMAPSGKATLISMFPSEWSYWEKLAGDKAAYVAEKERIADRCTQALEQLYPGIGSKIEMVDVTTPLTYARYTHNWKGVYMTWELSPDFRRRHRFIPHTIPGLENFVMASMWTNAPGGLPGAAHAGRDVAQLLCAKDHKRFVTTKAQKNAHGTAAA